MARLRVADLLLTAILLPLLADGTDKSKRHWWPHARGQVGHLSSTTSSGPFVLERAKKWWWEHPNKMILLGSALLDADRNVYACALDGLYKFSPKGGLLWHFPAEGTMQGSPSLMGDAIYAGTYEGQIFAVDLETGELLWSKLREGSAEMDDSHVSAYDGVVLSSWAKRPSANLPFLAGNTRIICMNASNGDWLWDFTSEHATYNFMPVFLNDGTFIFMDIHGGVYRFGLHDGRQLWYSAPPPTSRSSFTEGGVMVDSDAIEQRVAYTCSNLFFGTAGTVGALRAYSIDDGHRLWDVELPLPCNSVPAVSSDGETIVVPLGAMPEALPGSMKLLIYLRTQLPKPWPGYIADFFHSLSQRLGDRQQWLWMNPTRPMEVRAYSAQGELRWSFDAGAWRRLASRGEEGAVGPRFLMNTARSSRPYCGPSAWTAPTIDEHGVVYVGGMNGFLYTLKDVDGDGVVAGPMEAQKVDLECAALPPGASFAPGIMAFSTCDRIFTFRE